MFAQAVLLNQSELNYKFQQWETRAALKKKGTQELQTPMTVT